MNKIFLIIEREFLNRVQKKSFIIATILIPLIFPSIIGLLVYIGKQQDKNATKEVVHYVDHSGFFVPDSSKFNFKLFQGSFEDAKTAYKASDDFALLLIPEMSIEKPDGITLYTKISPSLDDINSIEKIFETQIKDLKMQKMKIDQKVLDSLKTSISIKTINFSDNGQEKSSNSMIVAGIGMAGGILMYMFIFIYGAQIMQGIIEEKTSKVVEVIVSSVKPFQLMMGKILGLASVGLLQFIIWILLMFVLTFGVLGYFGIEPPQQQAMSQISADVAAQQTAMNSEMSKSLGEFYAMPWGYIAFSFVFYFLGGYLLYGALFAAVGSSVDSPAEAQQFMFPITIPLLISYMSLFMFVIKDPHKPISIWLSIIPFTSPIAMMGRIGYGVPLWQLALSMILLIGGFIFTTWIAGRIYRVGILMSGTKVNYKVLAKWFMMKG
ncbi:MAG: ABC transporter permease [Azospira oryzae]|jgi:ABC-2 type transport system permease protein|nr:MAG: ABC transporter permease [Azospira oryzae]